MNKIYKRNKLYDLKEKAEKRKNNPHLRHMPNEKDILIALENTKIMQPAQYETLQDK